MHAPFSGAPDLEELYNVRMELKPPDPKYSE
jgi:hypothetical protein